MAMIQTDIRLPKLQANNSTSIVQLIDTISIYIWSCNQDLSNEMISEIIDIHVTRTFQFSNEWSKRKLSRHERAQNSQHLYKEYEKSGNFSKYSNYQAFWIQDQRFDWCRLGLLQNIRPLAFTNAAMPKLMLAQTIAYSRFWRSYRTIDREIENRKHV